MRLVTKQVLQNKNCKLLKTNDARAEAKYAKLEAEKAHQEAEDIARSIGKDRPRNIISKPKIIQLAFSLPSVLYLLVTSFQSIICDLVHKVQLNLQAGYCNQTPRDLGNLFKMMKELDDGIPQQGQNHDKE
ncbi:hypothetical protein SERLA73DRAFT_149078 [Serpula lacrymans var. lacrymans S7.3]|uniref:Uncharacterized protein n=1 Tax=Serpula lacrymans var. lacrymans (strain S7.3) TaxID=936435 RepID=F8PEY8_SERL3|nr:hypothetical protein SERLA73DRAFT_149078 [Serpula lacrymans var. lacrymans S7.3]